MKDKVFIDSNIFLYAFCDKDKEKQTKASKIILDGGAISVQVINEVSANMLKKLNFSNDAIKEFIIRCLNRYKIINVEPSTLLKAVEIRKQYNISYYDSSIIAAAIEANARILYSEDMQDSLTISELTIVNPFKK